MLRRVTVHGEAEKLAAIEAHQPRPMFPKRPAFDAMPLPPGPVALAGGGCRTWFPLDHPGGSVGYRLQWPGHSMAYATDTRASVDAPYVEAIRGVDLSVDECYFSDAQAQWAERTGHSHATPAAEVARRAGVGRLLLTHVNPLAAEEDPVGLDGIRSIFPAAEVARDEMAVDF